MDFRDGDSNAVRELKHSMLLRQRDMLESEVKELYATQSAKSTEIAQLKEKLAALKKENQELRTEKEAALHEVQ